MDDTRFPQYASTQIINSKIMTIKYYKATITDFPHKDEIICDADLNNKFRNNPHEKNASLFLRSETAVRQHSQVCSAKDVAEYSHDLFGVRDLLYHNCSMYNQHYTKNQLLAQESGYTMEIILYVIKIKKQKYDTYPHLDGNGHSE